MADFEVARGCASSRSDPAGSAVMESPVIGAFRIRGLADSDRVEICSWVRTRAELEFVSGETADGLSIPILESWERDAEACLVLAKEPDQRPMGFCTLTRLEARNIPESYVELCHLITDPSERHVFLGSRLVHAAECLADQNGYSFLCGRVVTTNRQGLALVRFVRAEEFTDLEAWSPVGFRWFRLRLGGDRAKSHLWYWRGRDGFREKSFTSH